MQRLNLVALGIILVEARFELSCVVNFAFARKVVLPNPECHCLPEICLHKITEIVYVSFSSYGRRDFFFTFLS